MVVYDRAWALSHMAKRSFSGFGREAVLELANKVHRGRAIGNLHGVALYLDGRRNRWLLPPQDDEQFARRFALEWNQEERSG